MDRELGREVEKTAVIYVTISLARDFRVQHLSLKNQLAQLIVRKP